MVGCYFAAFEKKESIDILNLVGRLNISLEEKKYMFILCAWEGRFNTSLEEKIKIKNRLMYCILA
jgi:hypothetical protein